MLSARDRYTTDAEFRYLVDYMAATLERLRYTPSEMRDAAMLASVMYEERHVRYRIMPSGEILTETIP